jgi:hypothetical protein
MNLWRTVGVSMGVVLISLKAIAVPPERCPFTLDTSKPYVYIKFDHIGNRMPSNEGEEPKGLWLRLVNNSKLSITLSTFDLGTGVPGVGLNYLVVPAGGVHAPDEKERTQIPTGYNFHVGTAVTILPGHDLLFSVPLNSVSRYWYIQVRFDFVLRPLKEGYNPYSLVDFTWWDLPERYRVLPNH